jgi:hypothetical protein
MKRVFFAIILVSTIVGFSGAQDSGISLRRGFREVELGATFDVTENALIGDPAFQYRGRPDVSMALSDRERVIDTRGRVYVERGVFSFHNDRLFSISIYLSRQRLDYFQLFDQLTRRYGDPRDLDPERAIWEDGRTRIELERPLTVRYLDLATFQERRGRAETAEALEEVAREQFLEEF